MTTMNEALKLLDSQFEDLIHRVQKLEADTDHAVSEIRARLRTLENSGYKGLTTTEDWPSLLTLDHTESGTSTSDTKDSP